MESASLNANDRPGAVNQLLPVVGPMLLIAVGYLDPGKWAATVEAGSRYGTDLAAVMFIFNLAAILCHYLSARIAVVTAKDLAQICIEEYDKGTCIFLGVQTEMSVILLDLTMILGVAHGLNVLLGWDLFTCVFLTATNVVLYPLFSTLLDTCKEKFLCICIYVAGFILLSFVLGVFSSQPQMPLSMIGMLTKLSGESAFSLMSLLGASIMPHSFYLHSSIVQQYQPQQNISKDALTQNHFVVIFCIFSGIYSVNYVLMTLAANAFYTSRGLLTFQDAMSLIEQVFWGPIVPVAFLLVLCLSNQITTLSWSLGGQVVLNDFLKLELPDWLHCATIRIIAVVPALYIVWNSGAEGMYQLLVSTQVLVALLLPSSVIPLFRVAASRQLMGAHKISQFLEFSALVTFTGMLGLEVVFLVEMLFGNSDWVDNLRWDGGSSMAVLLITASFSFCLMIWLVATPLKSESARVENPVWNLGTPKGVSEPFTNLAERIHRRNTDIQQAEPIYHGDADIQKTEPIYHRDVDIQNTEPIYHRDVDIHKVESIYHRDADVHIVEPINHRDAEIQEAAAMYHRDADILKHEPSPSSGEALCRDSDTAATKLDFLVPETIVEPDQELQPSSVKENTYFSTFPHSVKCSKEESTSLVVSSCIPTIKSDEVSDVMSQSTQSVDSLKCETTEGDLQAEKDADEGDTWEPEDSLKEISESTVSLTSEGPASFKSLSAKGNDAGSGAGCLSRLVGLGRAARRQLAAALDEFWGQLYDFHGNVTQEAKAKKLDMLLVSDSKASSAASTLLNDATAAKEVSGYFPSVEGKGSDPLINLSLYDSMNQQRLQRSLESSYGTQSGSSSLWPGQMHVQDAYIQNSNGNVIDSSERRYSSMRSIPSADLDERRYSSMRSIPSSGLDEKCYSSMRSIPSSDFDERRYSSMRGIPSSDLDERRYSSMRGIPSSDLDERRYSSMRSIPSSDLDEKRYSSMCGIPSSDLDERRYSSMRSMPSSGRYDYQPATLHGYQISSYLDHNGRSSSNLNSQMESLALNPVSSLGAGNYRDSPAFNMGQKLQNGLGGSVQPSGYQNLAVFRRNPMQSDRPYYDPPSSGVSENVVNSANDTKTYHSMPNIHRDHYKSGISSSRDPPPGFGITSYESSLYPKSGAPKGSSLAVNELSTSNIYKDFRSSQPKSTYGTGSLWSRQPFKRFGVAGTNLPYGSRAGSAVMESTLIADSEAKLLQSFRHCIVKLLKLEGSDWLFRQNDGVDEDLIDRVAAREKILYEAETREMNGVNLTHLMDSSVPNCGEDCIWKSDLIISFGVWCIDRILDLSLMESRPELWGKYTYVLNRLQGIIEVAYSKPRTPMPPCFCLQIAVAPPQQKSSPAYSNEMLPPAAKPAGGKCTTAVMLLDIIKDVEIAISCRKGRTGTAAGDVAFPKGKENLASVLKRYKRRLSNKPVGTNEGPSGSRKGT